MCKTYVAAPLNNSLRRGVTTSFVDFLAFPDLPNLTHILQLGINKNTIPSRTIFEPDASRKLRIEMMYQKIIKIFI